MRGEAISARLASQLDALSFLLGQAGPEILRRRPASGKWSAHENLAHLARHHEVMLDRINRILCEDRPALGRYRAEEDPAWPDMAALPAQDVLNRLKGLRGRLIEVVGGLSEAQLIRTGIHPIFGEMTIPGWMEFFLLHEAHHLYVALTRIGEAKKESR